MQDFFHQQNLKIRDLRLPLQNLSRTNEGPTGGSPKLWYISSAGNTSYPDSICMQHISCTCIESAEGPEGFGLPKKKHKNTIHRLHKQSCTNIFWFWIRVVLWFWRKPWVNYPPGTNIYPTKALLNMIFLFPRWDMLVPYFTMTSVEKEKFHLGEKAFWIPWESG